MYLDDAKKVFTTELESVKKTLDNIDNNFNKVINILMTTKGKIICTGVGKAGYIARKTSSTLSSLGISSYFIHPTEGLHGDLGSISKTDTVIMFSNSGESIELIELMDSIHRIGAKVITITSNRESTLSKKSNMSLLFYYTSEASINRLAPTSSTTSMLVLADAIVVVLEKNKNLDIRDYAIYHPQGLIGKKLLLKVKDIMKKNDLNPLVNQNESLKNAIFQMSSRGSGIVNVVDESGLLKGIITDGDLRRILENINKLDELNNTVSEYMTVNPIVIFDNMLAYDALKFIESLHANIFYIPVVDKNYYSTGILRTIDLTRVGF